MVLSIASTDCFFGPSKVPTQNVVATINGMLISFSTGYFSPRKLTYGSVIMHGLLSKKILGFYQHPNPLALYLLSERQPE